MSIHNIKLQELKTPFENDRSCDWGSVYPRPQMKRDSYLSLCGAWELYSLSKSEESFLGEITVPYPPESRISGIGRIKEKDEKYLYKRSFTLDTGFNKGKILLHFGAVDQICEVCINGILVGSHEGGYLPFSFEIQEYLKDGENQISVLVTDTLDSDLPYGKQRRDRGGMWYTEISGIWQSVWLESVPETYIKSLKLTPTEDSITIEVRGGEKSKRVTVQVPNGVFEHYFEGNTTTIRIPSPRLWSPEDPYLYNFTLDDGHDKVTSYFALRTVSIESAKGKSYICLNGKPYFFHGLLDQGYFSDGIYTPATPIGYLWDIENAKRLGFNMLRKHIKIEPELFYYYCDKLGMIVFQDMVNSGKYSFFVDTALPTAGIKRGITHKASEKRREHFEDDAIGTIDLLYNHPSVCYYTIFNEGWGQYDADRIYEELKAYDKSRVYDATSGWFAEKQSDVTSEHVYFRKLNLKARADRPLVLSEFGGYSLKVEGHISNLQKNYGYRNYASIDDFNEGLRDLYLNEVMPEIKKGLCATVLTQLSDVEDETNGLVTYDRQVIKADEYLMSKISALLHKTFDKELN